MSAVPTVNLIRRSAPAVVFNADGFLEVNVGSAHSLGAFLSSRGWVVRVDGTTVTVSGHRNENKSIAELEAAVREWAETT